MQIHSKSMQIPCTIHTTPVRNSCKINANMRVSKRQRTAPPRTELSSRARNRHETTPPGHGSTACVQLPRGYTKRSTYVGASVRMSVRPSIRPRVRPALASIVAVWIMAGWSAWLATRPAWPQIQPGKNRKKRKKRKNM